MPTPVKEAQQAWPGGEHRVSEPERVPLKDLVRCFNWDVVEDQTLESSPGYVEEFRIPLTRRIASFENDLFTDVEAWTGDVIFDSTTKVQGEFSVKHSHAAADTKTSDLTGLDLSFLGLIFANGDTVTININVNDVTKLTSIELRLAEAGGAKFKKKLVTGLVNGPNVVTFTLGSMTDVGGASLALITELKIITISNASGLDVLFDDWFITSSIVENSEPITGLHHFEQVTTAENFLITASGNALYTHEATGDILRKSGLTLGRMVHMITANNLVIAANGIDKVQRWDRTESVFRDLGVPIPPNTLVGTEGAAGSIAIGTYQAVVVFDMGVHGEGLPQDTPESITIVGSTKQIDYTVIPLGPVGTVARKIFRTKEGVGTAGPFFLDKVIANNIDTSVTSDNKDTELGLDALVLDGDQPKTFNYLAFANDIIFAAGAPGIGSSVFFSDVTRAVDRTIEQFDPLNEFRFNPDDGDIIIGLIAHRGLIYVFKRFSIFTIDPVSRATRQLNSVYGAIGQRAIIDTGFSLIFWSPTRGPVEYVQGGGFKEVSIKTQGRDETVVDAHAVNANIISTTLAAKTWDSQSDWQNGIGGTAPTGGFFSVTEATADGAVVIVQTSFPGLSRSVNIAQSGLTSVSQDFFTQATGQFPGKARDGIVSVDSAWNLFIDELNIANPKGSIIFTFNDGNKNINRVSLTFIHGNNTSGTSQNVSFTIYHRRLSDNLWVPVIIEDPGNILTFGSTKVVDRSFATVLTNQIRVEIHPNTTFVTLDGTLFASLAEVDIFEAGFEGYGQWRSDIVSLGATPAEWGLVRANVTGLRPGLKVELYMRTGDTDVEVNAAPYIMVPLSGVPPGTVAKKLRVQFRADFYSDGQDTPRLEDLTLTFLPAITDQIRPRFETNGVFFDRQSWFCIVPKNKEVPENVWKRYITQGWGEHNDYAMSVWTVAQNVLFSGSSSDGRVYRNIRDVNDDRIRNKDGRVIDSIAVTANSPYRFQDIEKSMRDYEVAARNESRFFNRDDIIVNGSMENWNLPSPFIPSAATPAIPFIPPSGWGRIGFGSSANVLSRETQLRNIQDGQFGVRMEHLNTTKQLELFQPVTLQNDTEYLFIFHAKLLSGSPPDFIRIRGINAPTPGVDFTVQSDGTFQQTTPLFDLGSLFTFQDRMEKFSVLFRTPTDVESYDNVRIEFGYLNNSGIFFLDAVSLLPTRTGFNRSLKITPILDNQPKLPADVMNLMAGNQQIVDLGLVRERFRIDQADVLNCQFELRHQSIDAGCKVMGLWVYFGVQKLRDRILGTP